MTRTKLMAIEEGARELACAVIRQAVEDYNHPNCSSYARECVKESARRFIDSDRLDRHISNFELDLNPEFIRRSVRR